VVEGAALFGMYGGAQIESRLARQTYGVTRLEPVLCNNARQLQAIMEGAVVVHQSVASSALKPLAEQAAAALFAIKRVAPGAGTWMEHAALAAKKLEQLLEMTNKTKGLTMVPRRRLDAAIKRAHTVLLAGQDVSEPLRQLQEMALAEEETRDFVDMFCPLVKRGERIAVSLLPCARR
jgi:hypothetical protein